MLLFLSEDVRIISPILKRFVAFSKKPNATKQDVLHASEQAVLQLRHDDEKGDGLRFDAKVMHTVFALQGSRELDTRAYRDHVYLLIVKFFRSWLDTKRDYSNCHKWLDKLVISAAESVLSLPLKSSDQEHCSCQSQNQESKEKPYLGLEYKEDTAVLIRHNDRGGQDTITEGQRLKPQQGRLVSLLLKARGQVVSNRVINQEIFGGRDVAHHQLVSEVNQLLNMGGEYEIANIRGIGYQFVATIRAPGDGGPLPPAIVKKP